MSKLMDGRERIRLWPMKVLPPNGWLKQMMPTKPTLHSNHGMSRTSLALPHTFCSLGVSFYFTNSSSYPIGSKSPWLPKRLQIGHQFVCLGRRIWFFSLR